MIDKLQRFVSSFILDLSPFLLHPFSLILLFSIFALAPLTAPGYFIYAHDARHWVYFLQMFDLAIRDGALYPRWATDMVFGYGYPVWVILAPLPFFTGEAFHLVGFDFVSSVKLVYGLALFGSALTMYLFASRVLGKYAGLVAALAYAYIPYHLVDLYVRSAQDELVGYVFPPLVFWAFYQLAATRQTRYIPIAALAYAGLLFAHITTTVLFTPVIGLYLLVLLWRPPTAAVIASQRPLAMTNGITQYARFASHAALAIALALAIAAVFVLPVALESKFLTSDPLIGGAFNFRTHFVNASQLLSPFWGYGYAGTNGNDQFSLQLGLVPVLLAFLALTGWRRGSGPQRSHIAFFALTSAATVIAMLPLAAPLWELLAGVVAYVQFPWRLLSITTFALAFLAGAALYAFPDDWRDLAPALAVGLILVTASYPFTEPQHTDAVFDYSTQMDFEVQDRELLGDTIWMTGERPQTSPLVAQYRNGQPLDKAFVLDGDATVEMLRHGGQSDEVRVAARSPARVVFYTRYFPGWTAAIDGRPAALEPFGEQGLILVQVPAGSHVLAVRFEDTPVRQAGALISGAAVLLAAGWLWSTRASLRHPAARAGR